jgi:aminoglycoside N3'-acetyltransferase
MNLLRDDLIELGIGAGDCLIVHCSFRRLKLAGHVPLDVIEALVATLGKEGTLMMPTFTYSYSGIWQVIPFSAATTPGVENGVLSETFRCLPGTFRSKHPTYSVAALGRHAEFLTSDREQCSPLGQDSSYGDALGLGAKILLLGVGNNRNSMLHHVEVAAGLPYNDIPFRWFWGNTAAITEADKIRHVPLVPEYPACSDNFSWLDKLLVSEGIANEGLIGGSPSYLIEASQMRDFVVRQIKLKPDCLLCNNFTCEPCSLRRRRLQQMGLL